MRELNRRLVYLGLLAATSSCAAEEDTLTSSRNVIYGYDDREELINTRYSELGETTIAFVPNARLHELYETTSANGYGTECPADFPSQPRIAVCGGVLISPHHVLTAAHCIPDDDTCRSLSVVRNFAVDTAGLLATDRLEVYDCDRLTISARSAILDRQALDAAIVRLAQPVPSFIDTSIVLGVPQTGMVGVSIAPSSGLPLKVSTGEVGSIDGRGGSFRIMVDVFAGASGSGIFDVQGGLLGIVVAGQLDYDGVPEACATANVLEPNSNGGELANDVRSVLASACSRSSESFCTSQSSTLTGSPSPSCAITDARGGGSTGSLMAVVAWGIHLLSRLARRNRRRSMGVSKRLRSDPTAIV